MRFQAKNFTVRIATLGMLLALSLIMSYVESCIPVIISIPGMKLGLANLCIVFALYSLGIKDAILINTCRIIISGFLFGNMSMIMYSLAGAALSIIVMIIVKRIKHFSVIGVSLCGGVFHNIGQCIIAVIVVMDFRVSVYLPYLILIGAVTGTLIGIISNAMLSKMNLVLISTQNDSRG